MTIRDDLWQSMQVFPATLGSRERLVTYAVGYGVGIGVPAALGVSFALAFGEPLLLLAPLPFIVGFGLPYFFRPTGFGVTADEIFVLRPVRPKRIPLHEIRQVVTPATDPQGPSFGLARVEGMHGSFGTHWNKNWGRYQVYITNQDNMVELRLADDSRVIFSPDVPEAFLRAVRLAAEESGARIIFSDA